MKTLLKMMHQDWQRLKDEEPDSAPVSSDQGPNEQPEAGSAGEEMTRASEAPQTDLVLKTSSTSTDGRAFEGNDVAGAADRRLSSNGDGKSSAVATSHGRHLDTNGKSGKNDEELSREKASAGLDGMDETRPPSIMNGEASNRHGDDETTDSTTEEAAKVVYGAQSFGV